MNIWDGNVLDSTNFISDKYLQINSCGFQNTTAGYTCIRKKGRLDYHFLLLNSGVCDAFHKDKTYRLSAGNLIIYAPGEEQKYSFPSDSTTLWLHFSGTLIKELFESCNIKSGVYFFKPTRNIFEPYSNLIQRYHQPGRENLAIPSLMELIYNISYNIDDTEPKEDSGFIAQILTYINANYHTPITLDEIAKKAGYSKSRLSHMFSEVTGTSPIKYQNDIRLKVSCEMLTSTKLSISAIAHSCGFNDALYYSRIFKKRYNMTPSEYRVQFHV